MNTVDNSRLILVPCDFTPLAFHAMEHGAYMSKAMNCNLLILHVTSHEAEIPALTKKMHFIAEDCFVKCDVRPGVLVRYGSSPYSVIKTVTTEINPVLVILKSGGGVRTVKILSGTSTPFLVIQDTPKSEVMTNISFPINFLNKTDEKLIRVIHFSDYYPDATMRIITPSGKGVEMERVVASNTSLTKKVMENQGIKLDFVTHDKHKNDAETILELSKGMDMIVIQMEEYSLFSRLLFGLREEKLFKNHDKIPVLCFKNIKDLKKKE